MIKFFQKTSLVALALTLVSLMQVDAIAQPLGGYGFAGNNNSTDSWPADAQPANGSFSAFYRGLGVKKPTTPGSNGTFVSSNWTLTTTKSDSDYYQFSVKPAAGYVFRLDSILLNERRSNTGIRTWAVHTSRDNYATAVKEFAVPDDNLTRNNQKTEFTGASYANIADSIGVRFYGYAAEASGGTWRVDSVRVFGAFVQSGTPVPVVVVVPATVAFGNVTVGSTVIKGVKVTGSNLTDVVNVSVSAGVALSADSANFVAVANVPFTPAAGSVSGKVFVKFAPTVAGSVTSMLMATSTGATDAMATITANGVDVVTPPANPLYRTIGSLRGVNANGVADSLGKVVVVTGTVHSPNFRPAGLEFAIADYTGAVHFFKATNLTPAYTVTEGDSIRVRGTVAQFRGLIQITPDTISVLATGRPLYAPQVVTALSEATESKLVKFAELTLTSNSPWLNPATSNFTAKALATGFTDTVYVRVDADAGIALPRPAGKFRLTGIASQFATVASPFVGGYQVYPRRNADIMPILANTPVLATLPPSVAFGSVTVGSSVVKGVRVVGGKLASNVQVSLVNPSFELSADSATFAPVATLNLTPAAADSSLNVKVFVRFSPTVAGAVTDTLVAAGSGLVAKTVLSATGTSVSPATPSLYRTIGSLRGVNANGVADSLTKTVVVTGIVHSPNFRPAGLEFAIADYTGAIHVFKGTGNVTPAYTVTEGDSIRVFGKVAQFRGLIQIAVDTIKVIAPSRPLYAPQVVTALSEATESKLVKFEELTLTTNSVWAASGNFTAKAFATGLTDTVYIRVDADVAITVARPTVAFRLTGIGSQFASTAAPYVGGYQVYPRRDADIELLIATKPSIKENLQVYPSPATSVLHIAPETTAKQMVSLINAAGQVVMQTNIEGATTLNVAHLSAGLYVVKMTSVDGKAVSTRRIVIAE